MPGSFVSMTNMNNEYTQTCSLATQTCSSATQTCSSATSFNIYNMTNYIKQTAKCAIGYVNNMYAHVKAHFQQHEHIE